MEEEEGENHSEIKNKSHTEKTKRSFKDIPIKRIILFSSIIIILIIIISLVWVSITTYKGCQSWECFNENLASCSKTKFAGGRDIIFGYTIHGTSNGLCEVDVEYLQGEIANKYAQKLANKKMTCFLPEGIIMLPETELKNCHGILKEKLQEQVISKLHNFILQNLGQINKELLNPLAYQNQNTAQNQSTNQS